ncbi:hypothetical protein Vadar_003656 [Vaccinium darrowii]|uniref:Uncharacterized protein n=1 Tax=Vaccinium darrowii TaxID=229202 RepID=A0ACB7ZHY9_9ERIC|nr:hypothetical protein Vadar_003656 [Vaccinium darrowii]
MFSSKEEVKYSVQKYSMRQNCAVKTERSSPTVLVYRCNNEEPCQRRLRAVKNTDTEEWEITRYTGPHTCVSRNVSQDHANLTARHMKTNVCIAFAIVEKDTENWGWFLNCIRCFVTMRKNLCLISDRAPGLMSYMPTDPLWRPPYVYHRYCARHIEANFMKRYNKKVGLQVKVTAMEVQKRKYNRQLSKMINWDDGKIHEDLTDLDRPNWSLAYDGSRRYGSCTTNVSECLNGVLKEARHLPITATVMTTFYKSVEYFFQRLKEHAKENTTTRL